VIKRKGSQVGTDELKTHVGSQLARFKVPREIVFVDDLPRTALGKVQHFMLKQLDARTLVGGDVA
jgi:fatty-acyl-CoA synthase